MHHSGYTTMAVTTHHMPAPTVTHHVPAATVLQAGIPIATACYPAFHSSPRLNPVQPRSPQRVVAQASAQSQGYQIVGQPASTFAKVPSGGSTSSAARPQNITVGGVAVMLDGDLGKGSYGSVFKGMARVPPENELQEVAVKEIKCKSVKDRAQAEYEAKIMKQLTDGVNPLTSSASPSTRGSTRQDTSLTTKCACPSFFASDLQVMSADRSAVRIVMERVHGVPIDEFTKSPSNKRGYCEAITLCRELLLQMCPTLRRISSLCIHRDVNAHNILLGTQSTRSSTATSDGDHIFTLIDFGLATDAKAWKEGDWKTKDIAGDCRYWPVSSWKQMLFGYKYLLANPVEAEEYKCNIDAHSLAITCLQLLSEVTSVARPPHAAALFAAFTAYWDDAMKFHKELYAVFQGRGTWANLKKSFLQQQIAEKTRRHLDKLKLALEEIANSVCATSEEALFCRTLKRMLAGRRVEWDELQRMLLVKDVSAPVENAKVNRIGGSWAYPVGDGAAPGVMPSSRAPLAAIDERGSTPPPKEFSHRRVRTTDNSSSMSRNVPEVGTGNLLRFGWNDGASLSGSPPMSHLTSTVVPMSHTLSDQSSAGADEAQDAVSDAHGSLIPSLQHQRVRSLGMMQQAFPPVADLDEDAARRSMASAGDRLRKITEWSLDEEVVGSK